MNHRPVKKLLVSQRNVISQKSYKTKTQKVSANKSEYNKTHKKYIGPLGKVISYNVIHFSD